VAFNVNFRATDLTGPDKLKRDFETWKDCRLSAVG